MHTLSLAAHKYKIEDRQRRVASMLAQSMTETEIAESSKMHKALEYEGIMHTTKLGPA
jgi:hypothetical protein